MCIIMVKKKEHQFDPKYVERMYDMGNKDGAGLMWVEDGRVKTAKTMESYKGIMELYEKHMDKNVALHLRNASFGMEKNLENCHPFPVLDMDLGHPIDLYMMHNGRFNDIQVDKKMSDSHNFATEFLRGYLAEHPESIYLESFQFFLAGLISPNNNKLVFLDNKGNFIVINEDLGAIHPTGVWVSTKETIKLYSHQTTTYEQPPTKYGPQAKENQTVTVVDGKFEEDSSGKLHFISNFLTDDKSGANITSTAEAEADGIDNGTTDTEKVDDKVLVEILAKIPDMKRKEVYKLVVENPNQMAALLTSLSGEKDKKIKKDIQKVPWDVVDRIIAHANRVMKQEKANAN